MMWDNYINYIKCGLVDVSEFWLYRKLSIKEIILSSFFLLVAGLVFDTHWLLLILVAANALFWGIVIWRLARCWLTAKNRLILRNIILCSDVIHMALLETLIFVSVFGVHIFLLVLHLPTILVPVFISMTRNHALENNRSPRLRNAPVLNLHVFWVVLVIVIGLVPIFTEEMYMALLIGLQIVNTVLSTGFLVIHRLYCLHKLEKQGVLPEDFDFVDNE